MKNYLQHIKAVAASTADLQDYHAPAEQTVAYYRANGALDFKQAQDDNGVYHTLHLGQPLYWHRLDAADDPAKVESLRLLVTARAQAVVDEIKKSVAKVCQVAEIPQDYAAVLDRTVTPYVDMALDFLVGESATLISDKASFKPLPVRNGIANYEGTYAVELMVVVNTWEKEPQRIDHLTTLVTAFQWVRNKGSRLLHRHTLKKVLDQYTDQPED